MKPSQRAAILCLVAASVLLAGLLFWPLILNNLIKPTALVVWLLLRILVLSVHQKFFWYALILIAVFFPFRVLFRAQDTVQPDVRLETNSALDTIQYWRVRFDCDTQKLWDEKILKRDLRHLLISLYALGQNTANNFEIYQVLQQGKIPLPEHIHAFLFSPEQREPDRSRSRFFRSLRETPRKWIRRWTGQEKAEHYQAIAEVLDFMERSLEMEK